MLQKKVLIFFTVNLLVFFSVAFIREWNYRHLTADSTHIRQKLTVRDASVTQPSKLPLQDALLRRDRGIAASRAVFDPVDDFTQHVGTSDEAHLVQGKTLSQSQAPSIAVTLPPSRHAVSGPGVALIVFCYNREDYLQATLESLAGLQGLRDITVIVSQDGAHEGVQALVQRVGAERFQRPAVRGFQHWQRQRVALLDDDQPGHAWLSQHYKWALDRVFLERQHSHVIVVEDDMVFSPDFLTLFKETAPLLDQDPSIWCVSSWNDNGQSFLSWDPQKLYRTSYFPGLGWMMRRELWLELSPRFPLQAWDHWMRLNTTSKGRDCVAPEVARNRNIGEKGVHMQASTFQRFLTTMNWEERGVASFGNLSYLTAAQYDANMAALVAAALPWTGEWLSEAAAVTPGQVYLLLYRVEEYTDLVRQLKLWPFPRGHFRGLTRVPLKGAVLLLADSRVCPYLPITQRVLPSPSLRAVPAKREVNCTFTCSERGLQCNAADFWFINSCEALSAHFACERGCAVEMGPDIPTYVTDPALRTYQTCLVSQSQPQCDAQHAATARLCPCAVPTAL